MIYPNNFETKIGFDKIREMLKKRCLSSRGEFYASAMRFSPKHDLVLRMLSQTNEFREILMMESAFPARNFFDLTEVIKHLQLEGTTINEEELFDMSSSLQSIFQIKKFVHQRADKYPELKKLDSLVYLEESIIQEFTAIIDEKN
jgi:DNA mismatch repair protein MutS2